MAFVNILHKVLFKNDDFCRFCFDNLIKADAVKIEDEVITDKEHIIMEDILRFVLPQEVPGNIATNGMCTKCAKLAISSYKFIKMCKDNRGMLNNIIETLNGCLGYDMNLSEYCKTLFVTLNTRDFTSKQYYDKKTLITNNSAYKRFKRLSYRRNKNANCSEIDGTLIKTECDMQSENDLIVPNKVKLKKSKSNSSYSIPLADMLYDKNDRKNYKCKICFQIYPSSYNLKQHFIRVHAPKTFKCTDCPRQYGSASIRDQHRYESHTNCVCCQCGKTYNNRHSLKVHEMGHRLKLVCQTCGRQYKRKSTYSKHITLKACHRQRMSSSQAEFTCDTCGRKFCQKGTLRVHITFEHGKGKTHKCQWCNKQFYAQSKLNAHIVKHTKEKNFICALCGGKFVTKESLLYHTRIHTGDKPYKCDLCEDRFLSASRRMEHVKRHHMNAIYECDICHSKFKVKSCLNKHRKKHFDSIRT